MNDTHVIDCPGALFPGPVLTLSSDRIQVPVALRRQGGRCRRRGCLILLDFWVQVLRISVQESKKILDAPRLLHAWRIHKTAVLDAVVATIPSTPLMQHWLKS